MLLLWWLKPTVATEATVLLRREAQKWMVSYLLCVYVPLFNNDVLLTIFQLSNRENPFVLIDEGEETNQW